MKKMSLVIFLILLIRIHPCLAEEEVELPRDADGVQVSPNLKVELAKNQKMYKVQPNVLVRETERQYLNRRLEDFETKVDAQFALIQEKLSEMDQTLLSIQETLRTKPNPEPAKAPDATVPPPNVKTLKVE